MLGRSPWSTHFDARCDRCSHHEHLSASEFEDARVLLLALGWLERARKGKSRDRAEWWCPACNPAGDPERAAPA